MCEVEAVQAGTAECVCVGPSSSFDRVEAQTEARSGRLRQAACLAVAFDAVRNVRVVDLDLDGAASDLANQLQRLLDLTGNTQGFFVLERADVDRDDGL